MRAFGKRDPRADPGDPLAHLATGGGSANFLFGRIEPFEIRTAATAGETVIGIALWSVEAARPIEELSIPLCIAEKEDECKQRAGVISLRSGGAVDLGPDGVAAKVPDAAMHIIGLDPEHVAGIFAENKDGRLTPPSDYNVWRVASNAMDFLQEIDDQQQSFGEAYDDPIAVGHALMELLFPENENKPNYPSEDNAARRARAKFEAFLKSSRASEPFGSVQHNALFVRMIGQGFPEPALYPVGLLAPDEDERHLAGFHLRVELPLPRQSYATFKDRECIRKWKLLLPRKRSNDDRALTEAYERLSPRFRPDLRSDYYQIVNAKLPIFSDMKEFRGWIGPRESGDGTAPSGEPPLLLAIVSHHDKDKIYFNLKSHVSHGNVTLRFNAPTMAILSNCSSATIGASRFVKALNSQGMDTVIATNTGIGGDLAGDFVECISRVFETRAAYKPIEAGDLFTEAQSCLYEKATKPASSASPWPGIRI